MSSFAGFAAILGLAILSLLYFSQAREVKRLREWARARGRGGGAVPEPPVRRVPVLPGRIPALVARRPAPVAPGGPAPRGQTGGSRATDLAFPVTAAGLAGIVPGAPVTPGTPAGPGIPLFPLCSAAPGTLAVPGAPRDRPARDSLRAPQSAVAGSPAAASLHPRADGNAAAAAWLRPGRSPQPAFCSRRPGNAFAGPGSPAPRVPETDRGSGVGAAA